MKEKSLSEKFIENEASPKVTKDVREAVLRLKKEMTGSYPDNIRIVDEIFGKDLI